MRGFTLVETLVVIVIFALVLGATSAAIIAIYRTHGYTWQQSQAINEARKGVETMGREIREARTGEDGSFPIEKAAEKELIFYSDINGDGKTERVRYFLGSAGGGSQTQECQTFSAGGSCGVIFSDFLQGNILSAEIRISLDGDFGWSREYAEIYADGQYLGRICQTDCNDCPGNWEGTQTFDVTNLATDNYISFSADASYRVDPLCPEAMKARFELSWTEEIPEEANKLKKEIVFPQSTSPIYSEDQKETTVVSNYIRNAPPIFEYFDENGDKIEEVPADPNKVRTIKLCLIVDVNPTRSPSSFELESSVQLRNLKEEY